MGDVRRTVGNPAQDFVDALGDEPVRAGEIFALAKRSATWIPSEIDALLDSDNPQVRLGAVSIMDIQARRRSTAPERRRELYEFYLRRHDRIDDWSMVDRAAPWVVGGYLIDKPRDPLYDLARSPHWWERRTAITATWIFIRARDSSTTRSRSPSCSCDDPEHFVQTAVGGWVREAGKHDRDRLRPFLDRFAATMPRTTLRFAIEHLDVAERQHYRSLTSPKES